MKKMYFIFSVIILVGSCFIVSAQGGVAINTAGLPPDSSALLDVSSTIKGTLITRMTTVQRDAIANPAEGLTIFNTDCHVYNYNAGTPANPSWATITASNVLVAGVSISANPIGAICAGSSVTFTAIPANGINSPSYQWQVNGGNVGTNSTTYTTSSVNNGDVVTCILSSNAACVTGSPATSNAITMLVNIVPTITGTTTAGFCTGSAVTLSASANLGTINWYADSTGGSSLSSGASFTISGLNSTTTYYVDATANGCTTASRKAVTATFYPGSPEQPGAITGPTAEDFDSSGTYSISALPNVSSYGWTVSSGIITAGQGSTSITVAWSDSSGPGSVSVVANNTCGTSAAQTEPVYFGRTITFSYTGTMQSISFPTWVTNTTITAYGAQGGSQYGNGALGGLAAGTTAVTPNEVFYVFVGGQNGYNGGGAGGNDASGGGMSDVRVGGTAFANWVIVAGGGGGGGSNGGGDLNTTTGTGGGGSACANGAAGGGGGYYPVYGYSSGGSPGTCTSGGAAGNSSEGWAGGGGGGGLTSGGDGGPTGGYGNPGSAGAQGQGGDYGYNSSCGSSSSGSGGGGGYYGGGGSASGQCASGSGGGGSSWAAASMTNTSFTGGVQSGNGQVVINW